MKDIYLVRIDGIVFYVGIPSEENITCVKNETNMVTMIKKKGECTWK